MPSAGILQYLNTDRGIMIRAKMCYYLRSKKVVRLLFDIISPLNNDNSSSIRFRRDSALLADHCSWDWCAIRINWPAQLDFSQRVPGWPYMVHLINFTVSEPGVEFEKLFWSLYREVARYFLIWLSLQVLFNAMSLCCILACTWPLGFFLETWKLRYSPYTL